jgi:hypothetical protein
MAAISSSSLSSQNQVDESKLRRAAAFAEQNKQTGFDPEIFDDQESLKRNSLECAICAGVIKQATSIVACGHVFCQFCIKDALKRRRACPVCAASVEEGEKAVVPALFVDRLVQQMHVKCTHSTQGCTWNGVFPELQTHLDSSCNFHLVLCEYSRAGCESVVSRSDLPSHNAESVHYHLDLVFGALLATQAVNEQLQDRVTVLEQRATRWESHYAEFVSSPLLQRLLHKAAEDEKQARKGNSSVRRQDKDGLRTPSISENGGTSARSISEHSNPPSSRNAAPPSPAVRAVSPEPIADENSTLVMDEEKLDQMMKIPELMSNPEVNKFLTSVKGSPDLIQTPDVEKFLIAVWEQIAMQIPNH